MAEEANVEIVELDKDFSPTDIPQFEDRVYTIQPRPELPHIEWCEPVRFGKGGSKNSSTEEITYYISHVTVNKHQRLRSR